MRSKGRRGEKEKGRTRRLLVHPPARLSPALPLRLAAWLAVVLVVIWLLSMTLRPGSQLNGINLVLFSQKWPALICLLEPSCWEQRDVFQIPVRGCSGEYRGVRAARRRGRQWRHSPESWSRSKKLV